LTLKVIDLLETLHQKNIVHTNLCPAEIFLRDKDINQMCFLDLFHCSWETEQVLGIHLSDDGDNLSVYDVRTRN